MILMLKHSKKVFTKITFFGKNLERKTYVSMVKSPEWDYFSMHKCILTRSLEKLFTVANLHYQLS